LLEGGLGTARTTGGNRRSRWIEITMKGGSGSCGETNGDVGRVFGEDGEFVEVFGVGAGAARQHIHVKCGLADCPEPVSFGKSGLGEETACHNDGGTPILFHGAILGLTVGRRGADADAVAAKESAD
jgi:hypothetical protein